jgi:hypothetical protein
LRASKQYNQWWHHRESSQLEIINKRRRIIGLGIFLEEVKNIRKNYICYKYDKNDFIHVRLFYWWGVFPKMLTHFWEYSP